MLPIFSPAPAWGGGVAPRQRALNRVDDCTAKHRVCASREFVEITVQPSIAQDSSSICWIAASVVLAFFKSRWAWTRLDFVRARVNFRSSSLMATAKKQTTAPAIKPVIKGNRSMSIILTTTGGNDVADDYRNDDGGN